MSSSDLHQQEIKKAEEALDKAQGGAIGRTGSMALGLLVGIVKLGLYFLLMMIVIIIIRMIF